MRFALFACFSILFISVLVAAIITLSVLRRERPLTTTRSLINPPRLVVDYSEQNIRTARLHCGELYSIVPEPHIFSVLPLPSLLEEGQVQLRLTDNGSLEYLSNGLLIWSLDSPRKYITTPAVRVLKLSPFPWKSVVTTRDVSMSLTPLAITKNKLLHWTFVSGFEQECTSLPDCPLIKSSKQAMGGIVFLFSPNRRYRAALLNNGDIIVNLVEAEIRGKHAVKKELSHSLLQDLCGSI